MTTYRTRQNVAVKTFEDERERLWDHLKPAVYFVGGALVAYGLAVGLLL